MRALRPSIESDPVEEKSDKPKNHMETTPHYSHTYFDTAFPAITRVMLRDINSGAEWEQLAERYRNHLSRNALLDEALVSAKRQNGDTTIQDVAKWAAAVFPEALDSRWLSRQSNPAGIMVAAFRKRRGMQLQQLASLAEATPGQLESWENGAPIPVDKAKKIGAALKLDPLFEPDRLLRFASLYSAVEVSPPARNRGASFDYDPEDSGFVPRFTPPAEKKPARKKEAAAADAPEAALPKRKKISAKPKLGEAGKVLADYLDAWCNKGGISNESIADWVEEKPETVEAWRKGKQPIPEKHQLKLAAILAVDNPGDFIHHLDNYRDACDLANHEKRSLAARRAKTDLGSALPEKDAPETVRGASKARARA